MAKVISFKNGRQAVFTDDLEQALAEILQAAFAYDAHTNGQGVAHMAAHGRELRDRIGHILDKHMKVFPPGSQPEPCPHCEGYHSDAMACKEYVDALKE